MQKIVLAILLMIAGTQKASSANSIGLVGSDFKILNGNDLKANACKFTPLPLPPSSMSDFSYWRCYETKTMRWEFDQGGTTPDDPEGVPVLIAKEGSSRDEYLFRRSWLKSEYRDVVRTWRKLTNHFKYVCLSAPYVSSESNTEGGQTRSWLFSKYKTRRGCEAYFDGDCDNRKIIRQFCKTP